MKTVETCDENLKKFPINPRQKFPDVVKYKM